MLINPEKIRPSFELDLYNDLLNNASFKKASEGHLNKISLDHSHENTLAFLTNGIRINHKNSPSLYDAFCEVKKKLKINSSNIDLYIENNPSINAGLAFIKKSRYVIFLNSGLVNLMDLEEIKFVIGHELGHLKYQHHKIIKNPGKCLPIFTIRLFEHSRYAEISADRCGLIAVESLEVAKSALLKIATGTNLDYICKESIGMKVQLNAIKDILSSNQGLIDEKLSHPYSLIRIYALEKFNNFISKKDNGINEIDNKILSLLSALNPKMNHKKNEIIIYACFWVSYSDVKNLKIEKENIEGISDPVMLNKVSSSSSKVKNKVKYFKDGFLKRIKDKSALSLSDKSDILDKVCSIAMADGELQKAEEKAIKEIALKIDLTKSYVDSVIKKFK